MTTKSNRGGYRERAGRHPIYSEPLQRQMVRLSINHIETLKEVDPSLAKAIRTILDDPETLTAIQKLIERNRANANPD